MDIWLNLGTKHRITESMMWSCIEDIIKFVDGDGEPNQ